MKTTLLTTFSAVILASQAQADDSGALSLEQAIAEGLGSSPTVQKYEDAKKAASFGKLLGLSTLLPHVAITAQHNFDTQYETVPATLGTNTVIVPEVYPQTQVGAEARWTFFDGLSNINTYNASVDLFQASDLESSRKTFEIRKKIELAFVTALAAQKFEDVAEENLKTLQENYTQVQNRLKGGVATEYDVLRVEVQLSDAKTEVERTQDNVVIERKKLTEIMGNREDTRRLSGSLPSPALSEKIQKISQPELSDRQDFEAASLRSQAADKEAAAAKGALAPSLGLVAAYDKYDNTGYPGEAYGGYRNAWNVGVFMRWNIFDGGASIARTGITGANAEKANHEYQEAVLSLPADFELWRRRYVYSEHRYTAKSDDLKRSQESYRISMLSFQQGRKTITDVLEAETDLFRARAGIVQSQLDAEEALLNLELTIGKEIGS